MDVIVRQLRQSDIKSVQKVARESWAATYNTIIPFDIQDKVLQSAYSDVILERRMEHSLFLVAVVKKDIVGYVNFSPMRKGGKIELSALYLLPAYQGRGIGTSLLNESIKRLGNGIKEIYLHVENENITGKSFYLSKGFQIYQRFSDEIEGHYFKNIRMVLKVND